MFASKVILPAVWLLFLGTASAAPAPVEQPAAATIAGAARDATATIEATSTGAAQSAAPKKKGGTVECRNMDGEFKPFCLPKNNDVYYPGSTHYGKPSPVTNQPKDDQQRQSLTNRPLPQ